MTVSTRRTRIHAHTSRSSPTQPACGSDRPLPLSHPYQQSRRPSHTHTNKDTCTSIPGLPKERLLGGTTASVSVLNRWYLLASPGFRLAFQHASHSLTLHIAIQSTEFMKKHPTKQVPRKKLLATSRFQDTHTLKTLDYRTKPLNYTTH